MDKNTSLSCLCCWTLFCCCCDCGEVKVLFCEMDCIQRTWGLKWSVNVTEGHGHMPSFDTVIPCFCPLSILHMLVRSQEHLYSSLFGAAGNSVCCVAQGHDSRADASRHKNLIMGPPIKLWPPYFSHSWFQQPGNPGWLQNIISLMDGSAGWQEWMIALRCHLPQTLHWHSANKQ